jgi:hypothetical protein
LATDPRQYPQAVRAALVALCGGSCYWPECPEPVIRFVKGDPISNLQIAHIQAASDSGPRGVAGMPADDRRSFANLILLCHPHHVIVDKRRPQDYPPQTLHEWKAKREKDHQGALSRLGDLTPDQLQDVLAGAMKQRDEILHRALGRLEQNDAEAAEMLRGLVDEVSSLRQSQYLDGGVSEEFSLAANRLYEVYSSGVLEDFNRATWRLPEQ